MGDPGRWGVLGIAGLLSFCCVGFGTLAGGAALAGGGAATVTAASSGTGGAASVLGAGVVTMLTVLLVGLGFRWRARRTQE